MNMQLIRRFFPHHCFSHWILHSALLHDFWSACSMDGTVNTSASNKTAVYCVHDRVC